MILGRRNRRFTIMGVGTKGSGKSSFFNNIVSRPIIKTKNQAEIDLYMLNLDGIGISQNIVFIDTPGFGTFLNDEYVQNSIVDYIKEQFDFFIEEESKIKRNPKYEDTRVHCLLYFVPATGSGLKQKDIVFLKKINGLVNIIIVISKADALTINETKEMSNTIKEQIKTNGINVFNFYHEDYTDLEEKNKLIEERQPFKIISADDFSDPIKVRKHSCANLEVDNDTVSDLSFLREVLFGSHLEMFIEVTANEIYEKYRSNALEQAMNQK